MMDCGKYLKRGTLVALGIVLAASMVGCGGGETDPSESSVPETTEVIEVTEDVAVTVEPTEEVTEPEEVEATEASESEGTDGGSTEKPANTASKPNSSANKPSSSSGSSASKPSKPSNSASKPSGGGQTPPVVSDGGMNGFNHNTNPNPKPTEPPVTEPPVTEPPVHVHSWVDESTKEVGHWGERTILCTCGWRCTLSQATAAGLPLTGYWNLKHQIPQFEESGVRHSYDEVDEWIVDTPAVTRWVCSGCGEVSNTRPN